MYLVWRGILSRVDHQACSIDRSTARSITKRREELFKDMPTSIFGTSYCGYHIAWEVAWLLINCFRRSREICPFINGSGARSVVTTVEHKLTTDGDQ